MSPYLENLKITTFTWTCIQVYLGSGGMEVLNYEINNSKAIKTYVQHRERSTEDVSYTGKNTGRVI